MQIHIISKKQCFIDRIFNELWNKIQMKRKILRKVNKVIKKMYVINIIKSWQ